MVKAEADQANPYFLILDEMNLSVVEHYFSDFLACIESRRIVKSAFSHDIKGWESKSIHSQYSTLAQSIVFTYFSLVEKGELKLDDTFEFSQIREHQLVLEWKEKHYNGQSSSWQPMFRTEFNNADRNSLVYRLFEKIDSGVYKLRIAKNYDLTELSKDILEKMSKLFSGSITQHELEVYKNKDGVISKPIPLNLYIIGTINMDESTHALSSKVLDRANTIEMNNVSKDILTAQIAQRGTLKVDSLDHTFSTIRSLPTINSAKQLNDSRPNLVDLIYSVNDGLNQFRTNMGHRSIFEITDYINNYIKISGDASLAEDALDLQFCQKLIPKLMGADERVEHSIIHTVTILTDGKLNNSDHILMEDMTSHNYPKTLDKLQRMFKYYTQNGFVNFANV